MRSIDQPKLPKNRANALVRETPMGREEEKDRECGGAGEAWEEGGKRES
jgi:hypothetical protein